MIVATDIELRAGARLLLEGASFQVTAGDRIGLVGRDGAGKTALDNVLAGEGPAGAGGVKPRWPRGGRGRPSRPRSRSAGRAPSDICPRTRVPATWTSWPSTG